MGDLIVAVGFGAIFVGVVIGWVLRGLIEGDDDDA